MAINQGAWQLYDTTNRLNQGAWQGYYEEPTPPTPPVEQVRRRVVQGSISLQGGIHLALILFW